MVPDVFPRVLDKLFIVNIDEISTKYVTFRNLVIVIEYYSSNLVIRIYTILIAYNFKIIVWHEVHGHPYFVNYLGKYFMD